jgi:serine/threonine protein kinase
MSSSDDKKDPSSKPPFDDQPPTPVGGLKLSPSGAVRSDTPLPAFAQRYEVLGEAGRGGMGIVYKARDRETGELVALKVLKPEIAADAAIVERFKNELRLARKITHKNVCRIHEFNRAADGSAYISMEFVEGESLRNILKRFGNLSLRAGTRVTQQICAGLHEAHAQGVVHRDLKPENVMLDRAGSVKIMDFGIARSLESGLTSTTGIMGTPAYMAPEQASGKPLDHRADIYSLGLILYEMFTGSTAFTGDTPVAVALKQVNETPPAPRELEPTLPPHVEKAILKCLEKDPAKRFQSVNELEAALSQKLEIKVVQAPTAEAEVSVPAQLAVWQRSDWLLLASGILGAIVFFGLFYRFHPASASVIANDAERQRRIVAEALKKLQWNVEVGNPSLSFAPWGYYQLASLAGDRSARDHLLRSEVIGTWGGDMGRKGKSLDGHYQADLLGRVLSLEFLTPPAVAPTRPAPAPDEASLARMKGIAQSAVSMLLGEDLSAAKAESRASWSVPHQSWLAAFEWKLPQQPQGLVEKINAKVDGSRLIALSRWLDLEPPADRAIARVLEMSWTPPVRYFLVGFAMVFFALILFVARKVYREPRSPQNLRLAILIGLGGAVAVAPSVPKIGASPDQFSPSPIVWGIVTFSLLTLLSYAVLNTVLHYLRGSFQVQTSNYLQLFREHVFARSAGLEMLRGVFAGAAFGGVWMALLSLGGVWGKAFVGMVYWLEPYTLSNLTGRAFSPIGAGVFPVLVLAEVLLVGWLLVALPLSLLSRATVRWRVLLAALSALWMAFGFSLAGAMVFPTWPYLIFVVLQAIFCGVVFLRYGLLATLSAVFTIEVTLLAFPLLTVFQEIDPLPYTIPLVLWFMLLTAAAVIWFRPQLVGAYRRLAAVFE